MRPSHAFPLLAAAWLAACQTVPYTGRSHMMLVSQGEESQLGEQSYKETLTKATLSTDSAKIQLIRKVGMRIAKAADRPDFRWEFNLIQDDKTINAWCLPGGKVAFYTGILPITRDEDGIAVVMGHEIAHALARHGAERMSQGMVAGVGEKALNVLLATQTSVPPGVYQQAYGLGMNLGVLLPFSRKHESEADEIGLILMAKAGYDPVHALAFWKRMAAATGGAGENSPLAQFIRTHPTDGKRQEQIAAWLPDIKAKYYKP
ncbi:MAG TPA: peptidase M48 family protein [Elusimicrobia bacterium]|nr:peptidase M48 family protein [Elusimicrobiota bacterium]